MIEIKNLTRKFGTVMAVDNLSLNVGEGEVFGLLGPNGAEKTTTIRMLCCLISKTSGTATIGGYNIDNPEDQRKIRGMIGLLPENVGLYEDLSAYANLDVFAHLYKVPKLKREEKINYLLKKLELWEKKDKVVGTFSKGMKQKLAIGRTLIHDPQVLFLDEPTANLDPEAAKMVRETILDLKQEHRTIFINTHMLEEAERICDRVGILKTKLLKVGPPEQLRESLSGRKTVVKLDQVTEQIVNAVQELGVKQVEVNGNLLIISVNDLDTENPDIVEAIIANRGRIHLVTESISSLEDVYLKMVKGEDP